MVLVEQYGGVFAPLKSATRPVFWFGRGQVKDAVFTCPVSAIAPEIWDLLELFFQCRAMGALPFAGGALDQPIVVRRVWPILEAEMRASEQQAAAQNQAALLGMMTANPHTVRGRR